MKSMMTELMHRNRSNAVIQKRFEPRDSLDDFPTPPWATRALIEKVIGPDNVRGKTCLEPCANRGYMFRTLEEYFGPGNVHGADIHDYGQRFEKADFLSAPFKSYDWVITNPPFKLASEFTLRALKVAREGVAIFARGAFCESEKRYNEIFRDNPEIFCPFVERVPIFRQRLAKPSPRLFDPNAKGSGESTATSYAWFLWSKFHEQGKIIRIPKCRAELERPEDYKE